MNQFQIRSGLAYTKLTLVQRPQPAWLRAAALRLPLPRATAPAWRDHSHAALRFVAEQLYVDPAVLAAYAARPQTRREQLDALRDEFGFRMFGPGHSRDLLAWLLPVALASTSAATIATVLMDELRRHRIITPGPSVVGRLIAAVLVVAERHVAAQLTKGLSAPQIDALDALLHPKQGTATSVLAWARQPHGAPGHRTGAHRRTAHLPAADRPQVGHRRGRPSRTAAQAGP